MKLQKVKTILIAALILTLSTACGEAQFRADGAGGKYASAGLSSNANKSEISGEVVDPSKSVGNQDIDSVKEKEEVQEETTENFEELVIADTDRDDVNKCISAFKGNLGLTSFSSYKRIKASIIFGGSGTAINDIEKTEKPALILVDASLNIRSQPTFNMLNPNGFYCIKNMANIASNLEINISCSARLADSKFSLSVGSNGENFSRNGIHIGSEITINSNESDKDQYSCIR